MNYNHDDVFGGYFNQSHERNLNNMSFDDSKNFIQVYQNDKAYGGPHQEAHGHNLEATLSANSQPQYLNEDSKKLKVLELADHYSIDHDKLMRKIDLCVIPPFALLYFISFLNKSSYGLVYVDGIMDDLHISKMQLASAYAAFFVPIICFQFFSNIALRIIKPHFWIAFGVLFYGVFNLASGFCKNYSTFVVCQFFHGLFQAGSESAVVYIMSHYYERLEAQRRFSGLYSVNCLGGMTANLISLGINLHFANNNGFAAWRWFMIILGSVTMFSAIVLFFSVPDFPEGARFFSDNEAFFIIKKLEIDGGKSGYSLDTRASEVLEVLKDPLIYVPTLTGLGIGFIGHGYALFEPVIYQAQNFGLSQINLFSAFPWILSFVYINVSSFLSDKFKNRGLFFAGNLIICIIGAVLIMCDDENTHFKYAGNFMLVCGAFASMPFLICWCSLNVCGHLRRSIITSLQVSFYDLGGLIALFSFVKSGKNFSEAFIVGFTLASVGLILIGFYFFLLMKSNKAKRSNNYKAKFDDCSNRRKIIMGDKGPYFDYMY